MGPWRGRANRVIYGYLFVRNTDLHGMSTVHICYTKPPTWAFLSPNHPRNMKGLWMLLTCWHLLCSIKLLGCVDQASRRLLCAGGLHGPGSETSSIDHSQKRHHHNHLNAIIFASRIWGFFSSLTTHSRHMKLKLLVMNLIKTCDQNLTSPETSERRPYPPCGADMHQIASKYSSRLARRSKFSTATSHSTLGKRSKNWTSEVYISIAKRGICPSTSPLSFLAKGLRRSCSGSGWPMLSPEQSLPELW